MTINGRMAEEVIIDRDSHTFTVDGEKFPWFISEAGPSAMKLADDLYAVKVEIFAHQGFDNQMSEASPIFQQPMIAGIVFPWFITRDGVEYAHRGGGIPVVTLSFLTRSVSGAEVEDASPAEVLDFKGQYWKRRAVDA